MDTSADVNILNYESYLKIMPKLNLKASNKQLTTPAGKLNYLGCVCTNLKYKNLSILKTKCIYYARPHPAEIY